MDPEDRGEREFSQEGREGEEGEAEKGSGADPRNKIGAQAALLRKKINGFLLLFPFKATQRMLRSA